jgi:hypothetical protein
MRLIQLGDQVFDAESIVSIRKGDKGTILVWTVGQGFKDNFLIEEDYDDAIEMWNGDYEEEE